MTKPRRQHIDNLVFKLNTAASMLAIHGLLSDSERARVHRKLISLRMALESTPAPKPRGKKK